MIVAGGRAGALRVVEASARPGVRGRDEQKTAETVVNLIEARRPTVADVIDRVLDKGVVIEYGVDRVSVSGIDLLLAVNARCVVASLDTYLEYAEPLGTHRLG